MPTSRYTTSKKTRRMVSFAMLTAIIIALQIVCTFIKFGPFSITLALAPIIVGAAIYGVGAGVYLGAVMGLVIFVTGLMGLDGGAVMAMLSYGGWIGVVFTPIVCFGKSMAAGAVAALLYRAISKKSSLVGVTVASVAAPVVNTGLFVLGMLTVFWGYLTESVGEAGFAAVSVLFTVWIGTNFFVELAVNLVLAVAINRIVLLLSRGRRQ